MKHLFLSMAAVAMLASCSSEEVLDKAQTPKSAIGFSTFVDKSTRAIDPGYHSTNKPAFNVWGWMEDGLIFNNVSVDNTGNYGTDVRYWVEDKQYEFVAIAPQGESVTASLDETSKKGKVVVAFTNNGTKDLVFATASAKQETLNAQPADVALNFYHMLSKVKFTFKNAMASSVYTIKVSNIKITNAIKTGTLTATQSTYSWTNLQQTGDLELEFGNAVSADETTANSAAIEIAKNATGTSNNEMLMIPTSGVNYTLTFDVQLLDVNDVMIASATGRSATISQELKQGYSYNFIAELKEENLLGTTLYPITFAVSSVAGWDTDINGDNNLTNDDITITVPNT